MTTRITTSRLGALALAAVSLSACGTTKVIGTYERAIDQAFQELETRSQRAPASASQPDRLAGFRKLRGRTEMIVFPKISNQGSKTEVEPFQAFASPVRFAITAQRLLNCQKLLQEKTDKWAHREHFPSDIHSSLDCGIFELSQVAPEIKAGNRRFGDPVAARLYLDSNYHPYGVDMELYESRGETATTSMKWNPVEASSSGLTLFPMDIPNLDAHSASIGGLPVPADAYVRNKMRKFGAASCKDARRYQYRDLYGNTTVVGWCDGASWPTTIENSRFFAITVRK